jgi:DNA polymerase
VFSKSNDWCVCWIDIDTGEEGEIVNDRAKLVDWYSKTKHEIHVGYNSRHYDKWIIQALLKDIPVGQISDNIVMYGRRGHELIQNPMPWLDYDVMPRTDRGLKVLEGFMGHEIKESSVSFDMNRPLTKTEWQEVLQYCRNDVRETEKVFNKRANTFDGHMGLVKMANEANHKRDAQLVNRTAPQLVAAILGAQKPDFPRPDEFDLFLPNTLELDKYQFVADWFLNPNNHDYRQELKCEVGGVPHTFGWGGIHGALSQYSSKQPGTYILCDVSSLYPALIIEYDLMSRNVANKAIYRQIRDKRIVYKREKNPQEAVLKLVLNSTFGVFKDQYNALYDPRMSNEVCIHGQLLLLDLIEHLEAVPSLTLIQSNTDGILSRIDNTDDLSLYYDICEEWQKRTRLALEFDEIERVYQRDVNNYLAVFKNGTVKGKGAVVKKLSDLDYDMAIVNKAVVAYLQHGTSVEKTINDCNDLRQFQTIRKIGGSYAHYRHGDVILSERCVRFFPSTDQSAPTLTQFKLDTAKYVSTPSAPEHLFLDNGVVAEKPVPPQLDRQWYIDETISHLRDFGVLYNDCGCANCVYYVNGLCKRKSNSGRKMIETAICDWYIQRTIQVRSLSFEISNFNSEFQNCDQLEIVGI